MWRSVSFSLLLLLLLAPESIAQGTRYFAVWSYMENAPRDEIPAEQRSSRKLGYWALEMDAAGQVLGGTYHGSDGTAWLRVRYERLEGRVYADLYAPDGTRRSRKSTGLRSLVPRAFESP